MKNTNFERGIDPKESMKIGIFRGFEVKYDFVKAEKILSEKQTAKSWEFNGIKVCYVEGKVRSGAELYWIELSNRDIVQFQSFFLLGEKYPESAHIAVNGTKETKDVKDWFTEHIKKYGSHILAALKCYEDWITERFEMDEEEEIEEIDESVSFERGKNPKVSLEIGQINKIKAWLKEMDIRIATINDDLTIDFKGSATRIEDAMIYLRGRGLESLPDYIQFNEVHGGFDIADNQLKTLKGCPRIVRQTETMKGSFKCYNNKLTSLEYAPKIVDGTFICYQNPGRFTSKDIESIINKKDPNDIWGDESLQKLSESFQFHRNEEPKKSMDIGNNARIIDWMNEHHIDEDLYMINPDGTITAFSDINIMGDPETPDSALTELPDFIHFDTIMGSFYAANNNFSSLDRFPKMIEGDFSIYSEIHGVKRWKESDIRRRITVKGTIWN